MLSLWRRLPVAIRAVLTAAVVSTAGLAPWVVFSLANQKFVLSVPWAILPTLLWLRVFWRYLRGEGWPSATSEARRVSLRANAVAGDVWGIALFAGMLGMAALLPLAGLMARLVPMPVESQPVRVPPGMPFVTVFFLLVMASVVAGVVEEAAFRGYLQGALERRYGPVVAVLGTGILFGLGHFNHHPQAVLSMLPFYIAAAAVWGTIAYLTNSILPSVVLHAGGDVFSLTRLWTTGQPEWQMTPTPPPLIWTSGPDAAFWGYLTVFILLAAVATGAYVMLAGAVREQRQPSPA